ncbi:hypothetical protein EMCRGX_G026516 [Ephydatia muelleri]
MHIAASITAAEFIFSFSDPAHVSSVEPTATTLIVRVASTIVDLTSSASSPASRSFIQSLFRDLQQTHISFAAHTWVRAACSQSATSPHSHSAQRQVTRQRRKQQCIVEGCPELITPSMWKAHMTLHAQGVFSGDVPITWLEENDLYICRYCFQLVSSCRLSTHSKKCVGGAAVIDNDLGSLWNLAKGSTISLIHQSTSSIRQRTDNIDMAISLGRSGMFGKACRILQSSGIAPNNENTWQLLKPKHPSCPAPEVPVVQSTETITLQPDFNILSVLQSFPKTLRLVHQACKSVINMLAAGKAPSPVSRFLAGGSLIALNKNKEGCAPDIRPIAVGETLQSLCNLGSRIVQCDADDECMDLLYQAWYLDDGALAGNRPAVLRAMHIIEEVGPALGLYIKCELFSSKGNASFPPAVKCSLLPNLDILGAPVGDYLHCSRFIADKCVESKKLLTSLVDVAGVDLQVAFTLLRMCGGFCKLVHLSRVTPSLASDALVSFDEDVRHCFVLCSAIEVSSTAWKQAQLSLRFGGLGHRSLSCHAAAAYIASLSLSGLGQSNNHHLQQAVIAYNSKVSSHHAITAESALASPTTQRELSSKIDEDQFKSLLGASCPAHKARLLSVSAPHSSSWVSVIPSMGLGLHMESNEFQTAVRWWLIPADVLIAGWDRGKPAAFDVTATSPLCPAILRESCRSSGAASTAAETRKLLTNGPKCQELGWTCIPLAVEMFCNWGKEAHLTFSRLASHLAISLSSPKPSILADVYSRMNFTLVRSIARAILAREFLPS